MIFRIIIHIDRATAATDSQQVRECRMSVEWTDIMDRSQIPNPSRKSQCWPLMRPEANDGAGKRMGRVQQMSAWAHAPARVRRLMLRAGDGLQERKHSSVAARVPEERA